MNAQPTIIARSPSWTRLPPASREDLLHLSGADGRFRAFDGKDGSLRWESAAGEESEQFLVSDRVLVSSGRDSLTAMNRSDGTALWTRQGTARLEGLSESALLASRRGELEALQPETGKLLWKTAVHQAPLVWQDAVLTVEGERDRKETLQLRNPADGRALWQTSDGDIRHLVARDDQLLYSAVKFGKHHQQVERLSSRHPDGQSDWTHQCAGELRRAPQFSPDGARIALLQKDPADPSRSVLSVLDREGRLQLEVSAALQTDVAFMSDGSLVLSEQEFSRTPGEEVRRLRALNSSGDELWSTPGRPDWISSGEHLVRADGNTLSGVDIKNGAEKWSIPLSGAAVPLKLLDGSLTIVDNGCRLVTVDTESGKVLGELCTGHTLFAHEQGGISDHEGQVWKTSLGDVDQSGFHGRWKQVEPFHIGMKSAPTVRSQQPAVFLDWDGDEKDGGSDPVLLDAARELVSWSTLQARDHDHDQRLNTAELSDLKLWFDSDQDGKISSEAEVRPLLSDSFDKVRIELDQQLLWLATDSSCG